MSKNKNKISSRIKPLEELTIMDDYMFGIVMREKENLKPLLERILQKKLTEIQFVEPQKTEKADAFIHLKTTVARIRI